MHSESAPVVFITGISKGIGLALARTFREHGFRVAGMSRMRPEGVEPDLWTAGDVTRAADRDQAICELRNSLGRLDVLINNAGRGVQETWEELHEEHLRQVMELNFFAPVSLTRALLPMLRESRGSVINVSSVAAHMALPVMGPYCSTKAALTAFSNSLRIEVRPCGIHVLDLIVGRIRTEFGRNVYGERTAPETPGSAAVESLARAVYRAWRRRVPSIVFPWWYRPLMFAIRTVPGPYERQCRKRWGLPER